VTQGTPVILSLLLLTATPGWADDATEDDDPISTYRIPFTELVERAIGSTSTPVAFDWRRTKVQLGATGDHLFELNNFNSLRAGGVARIPTGNLMFELGLSYTWVWDTPSSRLLALTPYRQPGRPPRLELDAVVGIPLAEGIVTAYPRFFPALQLVFNGYVGMRYLIYPGSYEGMRFREVVGALASPALTDTELDNLEERRLDAMAIDSGRYGIMAGFGNDIYFKQGMFISPRIMLAVPVLAPASGTDLLFWADISLSVGVSL
jgi:hypothetical protein